MNVASSAFSTGGLEVFCAIQGTHTFSRFLFGTHVTYEIYTFIVIIGDFYSYLYAIKIEHPLVICAFFACLFLPSNKWPKRNADGAEDMMTDLKPFPGTVRIWCTASPVKICNFNHVLRYKFILNCGFYIQFSFDRMRLCATFLIVLRLCSLLVLV